MSSMDEALPVLEDEYTFQFSSIVLALPLALDSQQAS